MINRKSIVNSPDDRLRQFNRMPIPSSNAMGVPQFKRYGRFLPEALMGGRGGLGWHLFVNCYNKIFLHNSRRIFDTRNKFHMRCCTTMKDKQGRASLVYERLFHWIMVLRLLNSFV